MEEGIKKSPPIFKKLLTLLKLLRIAIGGLKSSELCVFYFISVREANLQINL
jgi:hypothetical protein